MTSYYYYPKKEQQKKLEKLQQHVKYTTCSLEIVWLQQFGIIPKNTKKISTKILFYNKAIAQQ